MVQDTKVSYLKVDRSPDAIAHRSRTFCIQRSKQEEAILTFLSGKDAFISLLTGYNKSVIYGLLSLVIDQLLDNIATYSSLHFSRLQCVTQYEYHYFHGNCIHTNEPPTFGGSEQQRYRVFTRPYLAESVMSSYKKWR